MTDPHPNSGAGDAITLVLLETGGRAVDTAPRAVAFGALRLGGWQVHRVDPMPDGFAGHDAYLMRINYDLEIEPDLPAPSWFEIGFGLSAEGDDDPDTGPAQAGAVVLSALPHAVHEPLRTSSWRLGRHLNFVPDSSGTAELDLPAVSTVTRVFGVGGSEVRWRHSQAGTTGVPLGSYVSWIVLLVPAGCPALTVVPTARFDIGAEDATDFRPAARPCRFRLGLEPPSATSSAPRSPAPTSGTAPRAFLCYAHETPEHKNAVLELGTFLVGQGIDAHMDRWDLHERRDWFCWAVGQIMAADFVLVIASRTCRLVGDGMVDDHRSLGLQAEMSVLRELVQTSRREWERKILPVILPRETVDGVPLFLKPRTADHYLVPELTIAGADSLLRAINGNPRFVRPPLPTA